MRIALTALTPRGPQDLVVSADDGAVIGQVTAALRGAAGGSGPLAPVIALPRAQPPPGPGPAPPHYGLAVPPTAGHEPPHRRAGRHAPGRAAAQQTPGRAAAQQTPERAAAQETLWLDGRPVDPRARAASVLRDGALVATDPRAAAATSLAEPAAWPKCAWSAGPRPGRCTGSGSARSRSAPRPTARSGSPGRGCLPTRPGS